VTAIYTGSYFWVMDSNFDTNSSCLLPSWNHLPFSGYYGKLDSHGFSHSKLLKLLQSMFC
jgi:hypothetical protein